MVKDLKKVMEERKEYLLYEIENNKEIIAEYEAKLEHHELEIVKINKQLIQIENLGF